MKTINWQCLKGVVGAGLLLVIWLGSLPTQKLRLNLAHHRDREFPKGLLAVDRVLHKFAPNRLIARKLF